MADERLIVALDFHKLAQVMKLVEELGDSVNFYKVGMELFYSAGPAVIEYLQQKKKKIFLDLKLHDIPNTTAEGLCSLTRLGVDILNVHAAGGFTMMKTAAERVHQEAERLNIPCPKILAITVLTSMSEEEWQQLGYTKSVTEQVVHLAKLAQKAGLDGVVASPREAELIRKACGEDFLIVTPGVRPQWAAVNDQSRIATPAQALKNGSTHLVIGRPIRAAEKPVEAAKKILAEMETVK